MDPMLLYMNGTLSIRTDTQAKEENGYAEDI